MADKKETIEELLASIPSKIKIQNKKTKKTTNYEFRLNKLSDTTWMAAYVNSVKCPDKIYDVYYADWCARACIAEDLREVLMKIREFVTDEMLDGVTNPQFPEYSLILKRV